LTKLTAVLLHDLNVSERIWHNLFVMMGLVMWTALGVLISSPGLPSWLAPLCTGSTFDNIQRHHIIDELEILGDKKVSVMAFKPPCKFSLLLRYS
jgi:hypothetical protein